MSASIPPTPTSNAFVLYQSLQLLHPILCTVLEEGFSPPPPSSPGLKTMVPDSLVATYIRFFRHPSHHHFSINFSTPFYIDFYSILTPNLEQKPTQNRSKIDPKSDLENFQLFTLNFHRFWIDLRLAGTSFFELLASTGSKKTRF